jgi:hypothetical protein
LAFICGPRNRLSIPGNGGAFPRSKYAPRNNSGVPRNRLDAPRNPRIVPGSILAPRKDPTVPRNAELVPGNIYRFRYHGPLDQSYTGSIFAYLKPIRAKACRLGTLFLDSELALLPLLKPINKPEHASHTPANNISERLKYSHGPCLT